MQILGANQVRAWDAFTILNEPISSVDLMERAASSCFRWLQNHFYEQQSYTIYCGKGNNGGDGLAIARLLAQCNHRVSVHILEFGHKGTEDFQVNLARLHETKATIRFISAEDLITYVSQDDIILDALFGSGLNRPLEGLSASIVEHINKSGCTVVSIDLPSGLFADHSTLGNSIVEADYTLSFQCYKPALLVPENETFIGEVQILDIGLDPKFLDQVYIPQLLIDRELAQPLLKRRKRFSHKGDFGHAGIFAGSKGMMGAAVLCAKGCLRSGVGKLTCHVPEPGYQIMQVSVPEAMCITDGPNDFIDHITLPSGYTGIGIGPGIGMHPAQSNFLAELFAKYRKPMVIDADALNAIAASPGLLPQVPPNSILTPHVKEFERLFGKCANDFERWEIAKEACARLAIYIIIKGQHSVIVTPGGRLYFNSSGNPGMATAGSGDVLTGILTGLVAQGYDPLHASILGVYLHGRSGDLAISLSSQESLTATEIAEFLGNAFRELY